MGRYYLFWLLLIPLVAKAVVFRCEMLEGVMLYQDVPCREPYVEQVILPIDVGKVSPHNNRVNSRKLVTSNSKNNLLSKALVNKDKKQLRQHKAQVKASIVNRNKALRRKQRCNNVKIKIQLLQNRLRAGYTARQEIRLREQLIYYANLQKQYCDN